MQRVSSVAWSLALQRELASDASERRHDLCLWCEGSGRGPGNRDALGLTCSHTCLSLGSLESRTTVPCLTGDIFLSPGHRNLVLLRVFLLAFPLLRVLVLPPTSRSWTVARSGRASQVKGVWRFSRFQLEAVSVSCCLIMLRNKRPRSLRPHRLSPHTCGWEEAA